MFGLACSFVFCVSLKVKLTVPLLCVCVHSAWEGHPRNDLYCVRRYVKPYSLTHSLFFLQFSSVLLFVITVWTCAPATVISCSINCSTLWHEVDCKCRERKCTVHQNSWLFGELKYSSICCFILIMQSIVTVLKLAYWLILLYCAVLS